MANGPSKWTSDSIISTEYGKMLNTLVAISIQRMENLESFKWDMPTGLSSDVFMALASLDDQPDDQPCRLEQVWVRWHDSRSTDGSSSTSGDFIEDPLLAPPPPPPPVPFPPDQPPSAPSSTAESIGSLNPNPASLPSRRVPYSENVVEYPTFSVLPPLKSITVLEIDQVAYLDELSFLLERSIPVLKELRLSVANKVKDEDFVQIKGDQRNLQQVDLEARWPGESNIGNRRLGGVLGVVLGRVYNLRKHWPSHPSNGPKTDPPPEGLAPPGFVVATTQVTITSNVVTTEALNTFAGAQLEDLSSGIDAEDGRPISVDTSQLDGEAFAPQEQGGELADKVALEVLELARIPIHTWLCANAFDWTVLTSLTILQCPGQEKLWRALREQHRPTLVNTRPRRSSSRQSARETWQYHLKLRHIHVDVTTFALMNFLKETLAPNSLEVLFLHDRRRSMVPPVPIRHIFTGPIKRQHLSLKKLLLDSAHPDKVNNMGDARKMQWALPLETIHYITSGKMSNLRELSVCIDSANMVRTPSFGRLDQHNLELTDT